MTVFMLVVADIIPATSETIPLVGVFFSSAMVEMVIMIIVLCYIMRLYHKEPGDPPMSWWMRKYVLEWLSYKLGVRTREDTGQNEAEEYVQMLPFQRKGSMSEGSGSTKDDDSRDLQVFIAKASLNLLLLYSRLCLRLCKFLYSFTSTCFSTNLVFCVRRPFVKSN